MAYITIYKDEFDYDTWEDYCVICGESIDAISLTIIFDETKDVKAEYEEYEIDISKVFKQSMEVGAIFQEKHFDDERTEDWCGSEDCGTFTKIIVDYAEENKCDINFAYYEIADEIINGINNEIIRTEDHMWNDYCKGFLAGEILGMPTEENLNKVKRAEKLWENYDYGYYQEVLEEVV